MVVQPVGRRESEFVDRLTSMSGNRKAAEMEVAASIDRLFHWAAYADTFGGAVQETPLYGVTTAVNEPVVRLTTFLFLAASHLLRRP